MGFGHGGPEPFMIHLGSGFNLAQPTLVLVRSPGMASRKCVRYDTGQCLAPVFSQLKEVAVHIFADQITQPGAAYGTSG